MELELKDGTLLTETRDSYHGTEKDFGTDSDLIEKFAKLAYPRMPADRADRLRDLLLDLENLPDTRELTSLLAAAEPERE